MAMLPRLWTINGLAVETGEDRRNVAKRLGGVPPDGKSGREDAWLLRTYLAALADLSSYEAERTRYMKLRADALAREAAVRAGELVPIGPLSEARGLQFKAVRDFLLRLPAQLPPLLVGQPVAKVQSILKDSIYEALESIANCEIQVPAAVESPADNEGAAAGAPAGESTTTANS
jgi:hypothetical protein